MNNIPIPESPFSKTIVVSTHLNKIKNKQKKKKKNFISSCHVQSQQRKILLKK